METPPALAPGTVDIAEARRVVAAATAEGRGVLTEPEAKRLLVAYGIPVVRTEIARTPEEAVETAASIGYPVALKILSPDITHKSDVGGVRLELDTAEMVLDAAEHMLRLVAERQPGARIEGFTVQAMIQRPRAHELLAGVATDPAFGPVLLFGQGGTAVEIIADSAIGLPPLNELLARDLIGRTRVAKLLGGYRDRPAADLGAIASTLVKLSQMLADIDEIAELDINPLLADENGVLALDARVVLAPSAGPHRRSRFAIQPYPSELEEVVRSRGGTAFHLRPIRPEDEPGVIRMIEACEPNDIRLRFFAAIRKVGHAFAARLTQIDYSREMAFVIQAETGPDADILGVARLIADPNEEIAEFGIMVRSDQKGRGIGWMLMHAILAYARTRGFSQIYGEVLTENTTMLAMARDLGFTQRAHPDDVALRKVVIHLDAPPS